MRHLILGAGGIGGLLAVILTRTGEDVTVVSRTPASTGEIREIDVRSAVFGDITAHVKVSSTTPPDTDVVWVVVKAPALPTALEHVDPDAVDGAIVVPLLNGIDHVPVLRRRYGAVCPATIRIESHRVSPGLIEQPSPFAHLAVALGHPSVQSRPGAARRIETVLATLRNSGFGTTTSDDETTLLWAKLAFLAPIALATTAFDAPLGAVRDTPAFLQCQREAVAAAHTDRADVDFDAIRELTCAAPAVMRSSMQLDVAAGREPELDAIAGAVLRRTGVNGAPATHALHTAIRAKLGRLVGPMEGDVDGPHARL